MGLRPIYHHKEERSDGHLFITVLAYQRLREISEKLGVTYVDLLPEFRQGASAGTGYFLADHHWNAAGHALAARRVGEALLTRTSLGR